MNDPASQDYMKEALEQVRQALGGQLPEPHTPEFESALRRIQRERPDLLDVLKSLQDPEALPPTNATHQANLREFANAARRARSVERTQNWLNRWFGIKDPRRDKTHFNYRLMAFVIGGVVMAGGLLWVIWPDLSRALSARPASSRSVSSSSSSAPGSISALSPSADTSVPTPPTGSNPVPTPPSVPETPRLEPVPPPPSAAPVPAQPSPTASVPPPPSPTTNQGGRQEEGVVPPPPLPEYSASPAPTAPAKPAFNPVRLEPAQQAAGASSPVALKEEAPVSQKQYAQLQQEQAAKEANYTAVLNPMSGKYNALEEGKAEARSNPVVLQGEQIQRNSYTPALSLVSASNAGYVALKDTQEEKPASTASNNPSLPVPSPGAAPADPLSPTPQADANNPSPIPAPSIPSSSPSTATQEVSSPPPLAQAEYPFEIGQKQQGELVSGVVIPEGSSQAALMVRTKEGFVFFGAATLDRAGRLQIQFDRAYKDKTAYVVRAIALDERGVAGIPAQVSDQTPNLLNNLLRGAAAGLVSYIDFYAKSSSTTILPGGGIASSSTPPPLGLTILAGSAKQIAAPPDSTSVVRVWSLEPGTKMQILIVPGEAGGTGR